MTGSGHYRPGRGASARAPAVADFGAALLMHDPVTEAAYLA